MNSNNHYDVIVLGAGPAGLTAGIYLSRAKLKTLIINEGTVGGQMVLTHKVANYPGIVTGDMSTSIEGVYAAGECTAKHYRQVTTAVGDGTVAALAASNYLHSIKTKQTDLIIA